MGIRFGIGTSGCGRCSRAFAVERDVPIAPSRGRSGAPIRPHVGSSPCFGGHSRPVLALAKRLECARFDRRFGWGAAPPSDAKHLPTLEGKRCLKHTQSKRWRDRSPPAPALAKRLECARFDRRFGWGAAQPGDAKHFPTLDGQRCLKHTHSKRWRAHTTELASPARAGSHRLVARHTHPAGFRRG